MNWVLLEKRRTIGMGFGIYFFYIISVVSLIFICLFFLNNIFSMYKQHAPININLLANSTLNYCQHALYFLI